MIVTTLSPAQLKEWQKYSYAQRIKETVDPVAKAWLQHQLNKLNGTATDKITGEYNRRAAIADRNLSLLFRNAQTKTR